MRRRNQKRNRGLPFCAYSLAFSVHVFFISSFAILRRYFIRTAFACFNACFSHKLRFLLRRAFGASRRLSHRSGGGRKALFRRENFPPRGGAFTRACKQRRNYVCYGRCRHGAFRQPEKGCGALCNSPFILRRMRNSPSPRNAEKAALRTAARGTFALYSAAASLRVFQKPFILRQNHVGHMRGLFGFPNTRLAFAFAPLRQYRGFFIGSFGADRRHTFA